MRLGDTAVQVRHDSAAFARESARGGQAPTAMGAEPQRLSTGARAAGPLGGLASRDKLDAVGGTPVRSLAPKPFASRRTLPAAVLSDLDGTLVHSTKLQAKAWLTLFKRHFGIELHPDAPNHFHGSNPEIIRTVVFGELGVTLDMEQAENLAAERDDIFLELAKQEGVETVRGALDVLRFAADRGVGVAVATNSVREHAEFMLDDTGLGKFVDVLVTSSEHEPKPSPALYLAAAKELGADPGDCAVFEDSAGGFRAAWAAGVGMGFGIEGTVARHHFPKPSDGQTLSVGRDFYALRPALGIRGNDLNKRRFR